MAGGQAVSLRRRDWFNVGRLAGGSFAASAVTLLFLPVIARIFGPATIGLVQSYIAVLGILAGLVTLRYELAIMVAPPADRPQVAGAALCVAAAISALVIVAGVVLAAGPGAWRAQLGWPPGMALALGVSTLVAGVALVQQQALMAGGAFGTVANARLLQVFVASAGAALLGLVYAGWESLVVAALAGGVLQLAFGRRLLREALRSIPARAQLRAILVRYRDFPTVNLPANLLNNTAVMLPTVIIAARYGPEYAAFFALGNRLFDALLQPVSSGLANVYLKGLVDDLREGGRPLRRFLSVAGFAAAIGGSVALVLVLFGDIVVPLLLGDAFLPIVAILPWLAAWRFVQFVNQPVSTTFTALRRQRVSLVIVLLFFVPRLACIMTGDDFVAAVQAYCMVSVLFYALYCIVAGRLVAEANRA